MENHENDLSNKIIGAAIEVHRTLGGPGLLESIYQAALFQELEWKGLKIQRQLQVPIFYKGIPVKNALYIDLLVEEKIVIEVKSVEKEHPIFKSQLLTYLRLTNLKLGLLINFGNEYVKDGITRIVNNLNS